MKINAAVLTVLALFICSLAFGQQRNCQTMDHLDYQRQTDPKVDARMAKIQQFTNDFIANNQTEKVSAVVTIPIVFHVVYRTATENISEAQIMSQLQVLNDDFRRLNADADNTWSQAVDTEIQFCLATVDPNGNATTGITRTSTSVNGFGTNDAMKYSSQGGKDAWDRNSYLNYWVCNIGGGILGYAQFPGGSAATDGVVCGYQYTGTMGTATSPFDLGRTATHEVGHWLNLRHIWGDGNCNQDDFVTDTPNSDGANYGCATGHVSCNTTDMVENYMDYSDDSCMNLYTAGQKARMQALFANGGARASLLASGGCGQASAPTCTDGVQNGNETGVDCGGSCPDACATCSDNVQNGSETGVDCGGPDCVACPCNGNDATFTLVFDQYGSETTWTLSGSNGTVASGGPYTDGTNGVTYTEALCLPDDCYTFTINDAYGDGICCAYGNGSYSIDDASGNLASGGSFTSTETKTFCVSSTPTPTCTDGVQNGNETGVDCGGPDCPTCPTCDDGVQNGSETGVDCGGPDCIKCASCNDGIENGDETGVDCGGVNCAPCAATCTDGVQNGNETGVDCGGPDCSACAATCTDGVQNGNETGVDCGGPDCGACAPTCTDGVQNGNESGVDCGGPCPACVVPGCTDQTAHNYDPNATVDDGSCQTCSDGVMNGDETGIDCGGSCSASCGGCTNVTIDYNDFDSSWGIWNDGGSDCRRSANDAAYSFSGSGRPVRLRDNTSSSTMTTDLLDLSGVTDLTVDFDFYARSMENNEDFWFQVSTNGGASYTTVGSWARGDFDNNTFYTTSVTVPMALTSNTRLRFRCDASGNSDWVYIDDVEITGCTSSNKTDWVNGTGTMTNSIALGRDTGADREQITGMNLFPNPATDKLNVAFNIADVADVQLSVVSITGQVVSRKQLNEVTGEQMVKIDASEMTPGYYFIQLVTGNEVKTNKFVVVR